MIVYLSNYLAQRQTQKHSFSHWAVPRRSPWGYEKLPITMALSELTNNRWRMIYFENKKGSELLASSQSLLKIYSSSFWLSAIAARWLCFLLFIFSCLSRMELLEKKNRVKNIPHLCNLLPTCPPCLWVFASFSSSSPSCEPEQRN